MSPSLYWAIFVFVSMGVVVDLVLAARGKARALPFCVLIVATFFWLRWPTFRWPEQNPDESQNIAAALTLLRDFRPFLAVDAGTLGPLVAVPLFLLALFGLPIDFVTARVVGSVLLVACFLMTYDVCRRWYGELASRCAVLCWVLVLGSSKLFDFVAYNGEIALLFWTTLGAWLLERAVRLDKERLVFVACAVIGLAPWAKLQAGPTVVVIGLFAVLPLWRLGRRRIVVALAGGLLPSVLLLAYLALRGALSAFVESYIGFAMAYIDRHALTTAQRLEAQWQFVTTMGPQELSPLRLTAYACVILPLGMFVRSAPRLLWLAGPVLLGVAFYEIYKPGNWFTHYLLLFVLPAVVVLAALLGLCLKFPQRAVALAAFVFVAGVFLSLPARALFNGRVPFSEPVHEDGLARLGPQILRFAKPHDRLVVWGWMARFHVFTQLPQGVRYAVEWQLAKQTDPFVPVFVSDFDASQPPLFLDAISPASWVFQDRRAFGFERYPEILQRVQRDYALAWEDLGFRLFVRKDRLRELGYALSP